MRGGQLLYQGSHDCQRFPILWLVVMKENQHVDDTFDACIPLPRLLVSTIRKPVIRRIVGQPLHCLHSPAKAWLAEEVPDALTTGHPEESELPP